MSAQHNAKDIQTLYCIVMQNIQYISATNEGINN